MISMIKGDNVTPQKRMKESNLIEIKDEFFFCNIYIYLFSFKNGTVL